MRRNNRNRMDLGTAKLQQRPYSQVFNPYPPTCVLSDEGVEDIHNASMDILETVGLHVMCSQSREIYKKAGFEVDEANHRVKFDRAGIGEHIANAPSHTSVRGRDLAKTIKIGEGYMGVVSVGGPPFSSDLDEGRRPGNYNDMVKYIKLIQSLNSIHIEGGCSVEPTDLPVNTRHLDFYHACCTYLDKPWKPLMIGASRAHDAMAMAQILHQEDDKQLAANPVFLANTNTNTPLVLDEEVAQAIIVYAKAGQVICVTPFALAGAMAPATVAGALAVQNAETLAACALTQIIRPGCPYIYGTFVCNVDMKTGSPAFGTPEFTLGAQASGQMARRYNLPWRSSNTNASNACDAQSAYESQMSIWGSYTGHCGVLNQGAGWLEGGLVASFEKLIIDAEMLQMMHTWTEGLEVSEDTIGLRAVKDVGPGGHYFGTDHTLERYKTAFYQPILSDWSNFENWTDNGSKDAYVRANLIWKQLLEDYEKPKLDVSIAEELDEFVSKRKEEIT